MAFRQAGGKDVEPESFPYGKVNGASIHARIRPEEAVAAPVAPIARVQLSLTPSLSSLVLT